MQVKATDFYIAFRRLKNLACVELRNQLGKLLIYVRIDPDKVTIEPGFYARCAWNRSLRHR